MYEAGDYHPLTTTEAVAITKEMYKILAAAGINIIRVGLKSTDLISGSGGASDHTVGHTYHPAFRQLVEGEIAKESLEKQLCELLKNKSAKAVNFCSNGVSFSNMIGNSRCNKIYFEKKYPDLKFTFSLDNSLADMTFLLKE